MHITHCVINLVCAVAFLHHFNHAHIIERCSVHMNSPSKTQIPSNFTPCQTIMVANLVHLSLYIYVWCTPEYH